MSLRDSSKRAVDRLSIGGESARRRIALARVQLSKAVARPDDGSRRTETREAPRPEPQSFCRTCGTTFDSLAYACSECGGATIEPLPARADGGTDDVVENPP